MPHDDDLETHSPGDFETVWCAGDTAIGIVGGSPVYSDGDTFRPVPWPEALTLLARVIEQEPEGEHQPAELALFLMAATNWGSSTATLS